MNIARKLLLMIVAATVSIAVLSITGLTGMSKIESRLAVLNDTAIPSIVLLEEISKEMFRMRVRVLSHLMTDEPEKLKSYEKEVQKFSGHVIEDLERYGRELLSDAEDKRLLEEDLKAINAYFELRDKVLELSRSHKKHDAQQLLIDKGAIPIAATEALTKHAKYNIDLAKQEGAAAKALYDKLFGFMLLLALLAIGVAAFVGYVIRRSVVNSLQDLRSTLRVIEQNHDFTQRAKVLARDEVGETVESVNRLVENLQASMREISEQTYEVAKAARLLNETAQVVTESASNQSAAAADMAATVEEMTVSINHVADQAAEASRLSSDSGSLAVNGESIIAKTVEDINEIAGTVHTASDYVDQLGRDSQKVNEIIGVIKDVADQTNLLALNAAIEAARAGEQGRGFAVVADEVRKLAERTTQSTQVIAETISAMQSNAQNTVNGMNEVDARVGHGVERAKSANEAIVQIRSSASMAVDRVSEISNAIREQGIASTSIAQQVERIAQMSEENHAAAENTAATAQQLDALAGTMQQVVSQYKI